MVQAVLQTHIHNSSSPHAVQGGDGQWVVGKVAEDKREYQQMLLEGMMRRVEVMSDQLHEVRYIVP